MGEPLRAQAREWFDRGDRDLDSATLLFDQHGHLDSVTYHVQQALEKHLKGYLVLRGERPPRVHDLDTLLGRVADFEPDLYDPYIELCERATRYYLEDRYPPGPPPDYDRDEVAADLQSTRQLISALQERAET